MSAPVEVMPVAARPAAAQARGRLGRGIEGALAWAGDLLNPILVKEARQALKSKQFAATFFLLLVCAWAWTILGVAMIGPDIYYTSQGADLFAGYYLMLAFAMFVVVPFGAFRSLAAEQEDRTYSLLVITTLNPRQIVAGKLGSAMVQMLIYLSSIMPCLAFTYMLRGIDLPSIMLVLFYTVFLSIVLSMLALLFATLTDERHWQIVLSVILIVALFIVFGNSIAPAVALLTGSAGWYQSEWFWLGNAGVLSLAGSYFALFFYAAAAQLTFSTDNRSTRLRVVMLVQQAIFAGWMAWLWTMEGNQNDLSEMCVTYLMICAVHWFFMGAMMIGESPELSPRVRRQLPQSFLGRAFLTWFNPGPGTGYVFAIANMAAALLLAWVLWAAVGANDKRTETFAAGLLALSYLAFYLGLGLLVVRLLRKVTTVPLFLALLLQVLLFLLCSFVPLIIQMMSTEFRDRDYSTLHMLNPFWSIGEVLNVHPRWSRWSPDLSVTLVAVPALALVVFLLNLPQVLREMARVRMAPPTRVAEEEAEVEAAKAPALAPPSPWD